MAKTGEIEGETTSGKGRAIMGGELEGREPDILGGGLRSGRTLEGRKMDIMRCINMVTKNLNIGKVTEEVIKEAEVMITVEDGNDKKIGEKATMEREWRWFQMLPQVTCAFEYLLSC